MSSLSHLIPFSADLGLLNGGIVSVAHGGDVEAALPLPVALLEELLHDALAPLPVKLQRLGGVTQVGAVNHVLKNLHTRNKLS